jgi:nitrogen fixation protein NifU and related proteins
MDPQLAREMYKEHILELFKHPHNEGTLEHPTHSHKGYNPLCGDEVTIEIQEKDGKLEDIKFQAKGCAISIAATSLLTDHLQGKTIHEIKAIKADELLELLQIPISPVRMKCALLCLETTHSALGE